MQTSIKSVPRWCAALVMGALGFQASAETVRVYVEPTFYWVATAGGQDNAIYATPEAAAQSTQALWKQTPPMSSDLWQFVVVGPLGANVEIERAQKAHAHVDDANSQRRFLSSARMPGWAREKHAAHKHTPTLPARTLPHLTQQNNQGLPALTPATLHQRRCCRSA